MIADKKAQEEVKGGRSASRSLKRQPFTELKNSNEDARPSSSSSASKVRKTANRFEQGGGAAARNNDHDNSKGRSDASLKVLQSLHEENKVD